jgi:hypothetical protein
MRKFKGATMQKQTSATSRSLALALLAGAALWGQAVTQREFTYTVEHSEGQPWTVTGLRMAAIPVTGKPYSATAVTTTTQTLADGTKISRTIQAQLARDSEGRTRREQSMNAVGPWSTNSKEHVVNIDDPVAQVRYVLQPDGQTANKVSMASREQPRTMLEADRKAAEVKLKIAAEGEAKANVEAGAAGSVATMGAEGRPVVTLRRSEQKAQVDDLGTKVIEGVTAKGRRETQTIPVGQIGNDRPIQVVSETWYSDELQAIVLSKHSDPRVGDSDYSLTNISRAEPARSLFEVPAGYNVREQGKEPRRD